MIEVRCKKISNNKLARREKVWSSFLSMKTCTFKSYSLLRCITAVRSMSISQKLHFGSPTANFCPLFFPPFLGVQVFIAPVLYIPSNSNWMLSYANMLANSLDICHTQRLWVSIGEIDASRKKWITGNKI